MSDFAVNAKSVWPYPRGYVDACRPELTLSPAYIKNSTVRVVHIGGKIIGFYSLLKKDGALWLDHMWVAPTYQHKGLARDLWKHALADRVCHNYAALHLEADPFAAGFYRKMGAVQYDRLQSECIPTMHLPLMKFSL